LTQTTLGRPVGADELKMPTKFRATGSAGAVAGSIASSLNWRLKAFVDRTQTTLFPELFPFPETTQHRKRNAFNQLRN
jgi:hypothetical protein